MSERRALSISQATRCEDAEQPRCTCRCGGALHGARRGDVRALPLDDPHTATRPCLTCKGRGRVIFDLACPRCAGAGQVLLKSALMKERPR